MSNGICSGTGAGAAGGCCAEATLDTVAMTATPASRLNAVFFMVPPLERAQFFVALLAKGAAKGYRSLERSGDPAAVGRPIDDIGAIDDIVARDETDCEIAALRRLGPRIPFRHDLLTRLDGRHHRRAWNGERSPGAESRGIGEE